LYFGGDVRIIILRTKGLKNMIDAMSLPNQILGSIMQNFPDMPITQGNPVSGIGQAERSSEVSGTNNGSIASFTEVLAERLAETSYLDNEEISLIINEEIASVIGNHSTELISLLNVLDRNFNAFDNPMTLFTSMMGGNSNSELNALFNRLSGNALGGIDNFTNSHNLSMMMTLPTSFSGQASLPASSSLMGLADPFDALRLYNSMIRR